MGALAEGTVPTTLNDVDVGYIDIKLAQRGSLAKISDIVTATDLLDTLDVYFQDAGRGCGAGPGIGGSGTRFVPRRERRMPTALQIRSPTDNSR